MKPICFPKAIFVVGIINNLILNNMRSGNKNQCHTWRDINRLNDDLHFLFLFFFLQITPVLTLIDWLFLKTSPMK